MATDLEPEVVEVLLVESALEVGPGVYTGRSMSLDVDVVAAPRRVPAFEEVIEPDLVQGRR